jgi:hypothetical protein
MKTITKGPDKESFIKAFADRQEVVMTLADGKEERMIINHLQHEDGSGHMFNFVAKGGKAGHYNAHTKEGFILSDAK